jgi:hypothetical protein
MTNLPEIPDPVPVSHPTSPSAPQSTPQSTPGLAPASRAGARLAALAELPAPPSTIDVHQAGRDGYRLRLRRRRATRALTATAAAGVLGIAAVVLPFAHPSGKAGPGTAAGTLSPASSTTATAPTAPILRSLPIGTGTFTTHVPVRFGWLPAQTSVITEGWNAGSSFYSTVAQTKAGTRADPMIMLDVQDTAWKTLQTMVPIEGIGITAYWGAPLPAKPGVPRASGLMWEDASGKWLMATGYNLDPDTAAATLEHVARTVVVGDQPLPLPVQVVGLPIAPHLALDEVRLDRLGPGGDAPVRMRFSLTADKVGPTVSVVPVGMVQGGPWRDGTVCKDSNGWSICVGGLGEDPSQIPGGFAGLLAHIRGLGTDPAGWSADLFVGSVARK